MANQWFRMYAEFAHDPKVQMLSEQDQRRYIMLLCMRCSNGDVTLHETEVAFQLRISEAEWGVTKSLLLERGLIDKHNRPTAWDKRQYISDSSAARVAKHRNKKKQECNVTGNADETKGNALDTEQNQSISTSLRSVDTAPPAFSAQKALVELGVEPQVAKDWIATRKAKLTQTAIDGLVREAKKANVTVGAAIAICCERGWRGFKADWVAGDRRAASPAPDNFAAKDYGKGVRLI